MKKIVLFDIDYTLFNGKTFRETFHEKLAKKVPSVPQEEFTQAAEEVYLSLRSVMAHFDPSLFVESVAKHLNIKINEKEFEKDIIELSEKGEFLYEESLDVLQQLSNQKNVEIGIFSTGFFHLQKAKIAPLLHLINEEHMYILDNKQLQLLDTIQKYKNEKLFLIDDFFQLLQKAKEIDPSVVTVWMKRGRHAENIGENEVFAPDFAVETLRKVVDIVDNS